MSEAGETSSKARIGGNGLQTPDWPRVLSVSTWISVLAVAAYCVALSVEDPRYQARNSWYQIINYTVPVQFPLLAVTILLVCRAMRDHSFASAMVAAIVSGFFWTHWLVYQLYPAWRFINPLSNTHSICFPELSANADYHYCEHYDAGVSVSLVLWFCQMAWFIYACILARITKQTGTVNFTPQFMPAWGISVFIIVGWLIYVIGSIASFSSYGTSYAAALDRHIQTQENTQDLVALGMSVFYVTALAFSISLTLLVNAGHYGLIQPSIAINALTFVLMFALFGYHVRRHTSNWVGYSVCGGARDPPQDTIIDTPQDVCDAQRTQAAGLALCALGMVAMVGLNLYLHPFVQAKVGRR